MKNSKKLMAKLIAVIMIVCLLCCGTQSAFAAGDSPLVIKVALTYSESDMTAQAVKAFCDKVTAETDGAIEFDVHYNSELGSLTDCLDMIRQGAPMMAIGSTGLFQDYVPDLGIVNGPYLYNNWTQLVSIQDTDWFKSLQQELASKGDIRILTLFYTGDRHVISTTPISTPEDLSGLKVRVPGDIVYTELWKAFGAAPVQLPFSEVYTGLQQGIIDAAEAPLSTLLSFSLNEVATDLSLTRHISCADTLYLNETVFQKISPENQEVFTKLAKEMVLEFGANLEASEADLAQKFADAGVNVIEVDTAAFKEVAKTAYDNLPFSEGLYDQIQEMIK